MGEGIVYFRYRIANFKMVKQRRAFETCCWGRLVEEG